MTTSVDMWAPHDANRYGQHHREEIWAFQMYPDSRPDYFVPVEPTGGRHAERVLCGINCGALEGPETCKEYRDAYEHWHYHPAREFSRCSHD